MFAVALALFLLAILAVLALSALTSTINPRRRAESARRFAAAAGVPLTPELAADVAQRLLRRDWFDLAGRLVAVTVLLLPWSWLGPGLTLLSLLAALGGARVLAQLTEIRRAAGRGARVTHLVPPRITDYVRPAALAGVRVVALLPGLLAVIWLAGVRRPVPPVPPTVAEPGDAGLVLAVAAVATGSLLLAEAAARLVLRLRRVAGTAAELALDDAFRVSALRDLSVLPLVLGVGGAFLLGTPLGLDVPLPGYAAAALAATAIGVEAARGRAWRHRLHPELSAR